MLHAAGTRCCGPCFQLRVHEARLDPADAGDGGRDWDVVGHGGNLELKPNEAGRKVTRSSWPLRAYRTQLRRTANDSNTRSGVAEPATATARASRTER